VEGSAESAGHIVICEAETKGSRSKVSGKWSS